MNKLLSVLTQSFGQQDAPLYPFIEELEMQRLHYAQRKKEIEELVTLLSMRVEAEAAYARSLMAIADREDNAIRIGMLAQEVDCFKQDCLAKAKAAEELADNVAQDCVHPLQNLVDEQQQAFSRIFTEGMRHISKMTDLNSQVKSLANRYFDSSENAEKFIFNFQELKLNTEIPLQKRRSLHESVINTINIAKEKKQMYEQILPEANETLSHFVTSLRDFKKQL